MNVEKCFNSFCKFDDCFADCNNMYVFALYLKFLHDKLNRYNNLLSDNQHNKAYLLRKDFQVKFLDLITDLENGFDEIVKENNEIIPVK